MPHLLTAARAAIAAFQASRADAARRARACDRQNRAALSRHRTRGNPLRGVNVYPVSL